MSESNQMSLPSMVLTPLLLRVIFWITFFVTRLPLALLLFIASSEKSYSSEVFLSFGLGLSCTRTVSASPLWLALNHIILDPSSPVVMSYSLSRVTEVTAKRLA